MSNVFSFVGTIGRDSELKHTQSGASILTFTVANNVGFGDRQKTNWVRVNMWGERGVKLQEYTKKGQQVFCSGELSQSEFTAKDGTGKTALELNANVIDLVGKREQ